MGGIDRFYVTCWVLRTLLAVAAAAGFLMATSRGCMT